MRDDAIESNLYNKAEEIYKQISSATFMHSMFKWLHYDQCIRAAGSIAANIAEGIGRKRVGYPGYLHFFSIANGSAYETRAWLRLGVLDKVWTIELAGAIEALLVELSKAIDEVLENSQPITKCSKAKQLTLKNREDDQHFLGIDQ